MLDGTKTMRTPTMTTRTSRLSLYLQLRSEIYCCPLTHLHCVNASHQTTASSQPVPPQFLALPLLPTLKAGRKQDPQNGHQNDDKKHVLYGRGPTFATQIWTRNPGSFEGPCLGSRALLEIAGPRPSRQMASTPPCPALGAENCGFSLPPEVTRIRSNGP